MAIVGQFVSIAFVFSVLLASAALLVPVELRVSYRRTHNDDHFCIEIRSLGGVIYHKYVVPVSDFQIDRLVPHLKLKSDTSESPGRQTSSLEHELVIESIERFRAASARLRRRWEQYRPVFGLIVKHATFTHFDWWTEFGLGDAALTGIVVGLAWMVKGSVTGILRHSSRFATKPHVLVRPFFNRVVFQTDFNCIVRVHLGDIMVARLLLAKKES